MVYALIALLALAPLPFGSVTVFWQSLLAAGAFALAGSAALVFPARFGWPPAGQRPLAFAALAFAAVCCWSLAQALLPFWPHPAWEEAVRALSSGGRTLSLSMDPASGLIGTASLAGLGALFLAAVAIGSDAVRARIVLRAIALIGLVYAGYGLAVFFTGNDTVAWLAKQHYRDSLSATFINRNTYGVFAGLGLLVAIALFTQTIAADLRASGRRRDRILRAAETLGRSGWIWLLAIAAGTTALLLTGSRGATAATAIAALVLVMVYLTAARAPARSLLAMAGLVIVTALLLFDLSGAHLAERLAYLDRSTEMRTDIYTIALATIADHLWLGAGYGAFEDAFAIYDSSDRSFSPRLVHAHSVYLQVVAELGLPAALLLFTSIAIPIGICVRGLVHRRRDRIYPALGIAASILVGVQGLTDFGVQTPAVASLYAVLLGLGVAQSVSSRRRR